ncbi:organic solute transporter Ostalpha-domain-containing protein, partial [Cyathus striatus]
IGWIVAGAFTLVAIITSGWLLNKHLRWYTDKQQQRYIVRILFMVPIYAAISFASYLFWNHSTPLLLLRDAYEAIVLTAFFYLLLSYLSPDIEEQKHIFVMHGLSKEAERCQYEDDECPQRWIFPLGFIQWKPADGLFFLQLMKWGILQYCVIRPLTTFIAVVLDHFGLYCEESWGLGWGHIYITVILSISVTIAMYCLIQLYVSVSVQLSSQHPLLKLFSVKAVVFLTFWQATFLSILSMLGVVKDTKYMTAETINIGIGALLETFEMMLFAFLHIRAFTYKVYRPLYEDSCVETPRLKSLCHAMDFRETFREVWYGCRYLYDQIRGEEPAQDLVVRRQIYYKEAFGRQRFGKTRTSKNRRDIQVDNVDLHGEPSFGIEIPSTEGEARHSLSLPCESLIHAFLSVILSIPQLLHIVPIERGGKAITNVFLKWSKILQCGADPTAVAPKNDEYIYHMIPSPLSLIM